MVQFQHRKSPSHGHAPCPSDSRSAALCECGRLCRGPAKSRYLAESVARFRAGDLQELTAARRPCTRVAEAPRRPCAHTSPDRPARWSSAGSVERQQHGATPTDAPTASVAPSWVAVVRPIAASSASALASAWASSQFQSSSANSSPADPGHHIGFAHVAAEHARHRAQHRVAGGVPVAIVDALEIVEVEIEQYGAGAVALHIGERTGELALECAAIGQIGQRIDVGARFERSHLLARAARAPVRGARPRRRAARRRTAGALRGLSAPSAGVRCRRCGSACARARLDRELRLDTACPACLSASAIAAPESSIGKDSRAPDSGQIRLLLGVDMIVRSARLCVPEAGPSLLNGATRQAAASRPLDRLLAGDGALRTAPTRPRGRA